MDQETLFEEIRTRLREAQEDCVSDPWIYEDEDLVVSVRSAIRHLRSLGVSLDLSMNLSGVFDTDPTETQGMLIALKVASDLLLGDLTKKLNKGELGVSFKSVMDSYSSTEASRAFQNAGKAFAMDFKTLLTIVLTNNTDTASGVFGQQGTSFASE